VWEERAYRARRDITALAAEGLGVSDLHAAAIALTEAEVRTDLTCWATIDPETLVISTMASGDARIPSEYEPPLAQAEYSSEEPHTFAALAQRNQLMARLSDLPDRDRNRSSRLNNVWRPLGLEHELRIMFLIDGACWGGAGMVRAGRDFTDRETDFLAAVAPAIATATRLAVRSEASGSMAVGHPAIVVIGPRGEIRALTRAGQLWRERLDQIAPGRFMLMMQVMALGARSATSGSFRTRLRDASGQWASLQASPLIGGDEDQIAVTIEPASGDQLISLLFTAYGLTVREREICGEITAGHSTSDIAERLFISTNTVQDHLKSVFGKVGVRSRGELVARLRPNGSMPESPNSRGDGPARSDRLS
jgi:DNA-binding CsgD family transcriptional regulator